MSVITHQIRKLLWRIGYDVSRLDPSRSSVARMRQLFKSYAIDVVLDVGANTGGFARELRGDIGFSGKIISFEPMRSAFQALRDAAKRDEQWVAINCGLGHEIATMEINVAGNSESSSLRDMLPAHLGAAPSSAYVSKEMIQIKTLDSMIDDLCSTRDRVYLKIDTQGYEREVLEGARASLARIDTVQLEMSLVPLYAGGPLFEEMHALMSDKGFRLVTIDPFFSDESSGELLQVDGIYRRLIPSGN
jgi:FkbM family methyltransferase